MADYDQIGASANNIGFKIVVITVAAVLALIIGSVWWNVSQIAAVDTFEECAAKYPVMESYPSQCRTPDGRIFTAPLKNPR